MTAAWTNNGGKGVRPVVENIRDRVRTMTFRGIRTTARELHVQRKYGRERLWYVSTAKDSGNDPQYAFGEAVLRAFATYRAR